MARMLVKPGVATTVLALALAAAGCGSTRTVTVTQTVAKTVTTTSKPRRAPTRTITRTVTVTVPAGTSTPPRYAPGYPASFESAFSIHCMQSGGSYKACGCALTRVESTVSYRTVVAAEHAIAIGNPPGWYTSAAASCVG